MMSNKYKISLIMKCDNSPPIELRVMGEQRGNKSPNTVSKSGVKII